MLLFISGIIMSFFYFDKIIEDIFFIFEYVGVGGVRILFFGDGGVMIESLVEVG
jgi:hypothetical protein